MAIIGTVPKKLARHVACVRASCQWIRSNGRGLRWSRELDEAAGSSHVQHNEIFLTGVSREAKAYLQLGGLCSYCTNIIMDHTGSHTGTLLVLERQRERGALVCSLPRAACKFGPETL